MEGSPSGGMCGETGQGGVKVGRWGGRGIDVNVERTSSRKVNAGGRMGDIMVAVELDGGLQGRGRGGDQAETLIRVSESDGFAETAIGTARDGVDSALEDGGDELCRETVHLLRELVGSANERTSELANGATYRWPYRSEQKRKQKEAAWVGDRNVECETSVAGKRTGREDVRTGKDGQGHR